MNTGCEIDIQSHFPFPPSIPASPAIAFSLQPKTFKTGRRKVGKIGNEETVMYKRFYHTNYQSVYQKKKRKTFQLCV